MANTDIAAGFRCFSTINRSPSRYQRDADSATPIFSGDIVEFDGDTDGYIGAAAAGETDLLGVSDDFATGSAAKDPIMVYDDPDQKFVGQDDGDSTTSALTHVNNLCNHIAGSGSLTTLLSGHEIDISDVGTSTAGLRLLEFVQREDNAIGANAEWICLVHEHLFSGTGGA